MTLSPMSEPDRRRAAVIVADAIRGCSSPSRAVRALSCLPDETLVILLAAASEILIGDGLQERGLIR